jgi:hypothetical protein
VFICDYSDLSYNDNILYSISTDEKGARIMRKLLAILILFLISTSLIAVARTQETSFDLRESPNADAKSVAQLPLGTPIMPIIRQNGWVKVADPKTGHVGWVQSNRIEKSPVVITQIIAGNSDYCKDNNCQFSFYSSSRPITPQQNDALWQRIHTQEQYILAQQAAMQKQMHEFMNDLNTLMMQSVTTTQDEAVPASTDQTAIQKQPKAEKRPFWKLWGKQKN